MLLPLYNERQKLPLDSIKDLPRFMDPNQQHFNLVGFGYDTTPDWAKNSMALRLAYYALFTIPICIGDTEFALGNYERAIFHYGRTTRFQVGIAHESDKAGKTSHMHYWHGDKPFTTYKPSEVPSVFRLPTGGIHATNCSFC
jgi:hypothetical protein